MFPHHGCHNLPTRIWIIHPVLAMFSSLNSDPSKLTLTFGQGGGFQFRCFMASLGQPGGFGGMEQT